MAEPFTPQGFEKVTVVGDAGSYTSYDTYGFDINEFNMGIRIFNLTGKGPTRDDADYCLSAIANKNISIDEQNTIITSYMNDKHPTV